MGGLEISVIQKSGLERTVRIDPEFYSKINLEVVQQLRDLNTMSFADSFHVSDGNHMSISDDFVAEGIPYYRGQDIYSFFIEESSPNYITERAYNAPYMKRSHLKQGDVLLSIVGAIIGNASIVMTSQKATCSCKLAILRAKHDYILPEVLITFIKSKYGQNQIQKFRRGGSQTGLLLEDFDQLVIPVYSKHFQERISSVFIYAQKMMLDSNIEYSVADSILMSEIDVDASVKNNHGFSIKKLSSTFASSGRLDAEYYHPKYDEIENRLLRLECTSIDCEFELVKNNYSNYSNNGDIGVIKTKQISKIGFINENVDSLFTMETIKQNNINLLQNRDVIFASMGVGSLGKTNIFYGDSKFATDSTLKIFRQKSNGRIYPEVLTVFLQSSVGQDLVYKYIVGSTGIINIYESDLFQIPVPIFDNDIQQEITRKVQSSYVLKKKSMSLLEYSKHAVEIAIEQNEETALKWLDEVMQDGYV